MSCFFIQILPYTSLILFFFNDTATTEIYTLSLHDALPISWPKIYSRPLRQKQKEARKKNLQAPKVCTKPRNKASVQAGVHADQDRKSTRLNSSHGYISYAVFCLKKKK